MENPLFSLDFETIFDDFHHWIEYLHIEDVPNDRLMYFKESPVGNLHKRKYYFLSISNTRIEPIWEDGLDGYEDIYQEYLEITPDETILGTLIIQVLDNYKIRISGYVDPKGHSNEWLMFWNCFIRRYFPEYPDIEIETLQTILSTAENVERKTESPVSTKTLKNIANLSSIDIDKNGLPIEICQELKRDPTCFNCKNALIILLAIPKAYDNCSQGDNRWGPTFLAEYLKLLPPGDKEDTQLTRIDLKSTVVCRYLGKLMRIGVKSVDGIELPHRLHKSKQ